MNKNIIDAIVHERKYQTLMHGSIDKHPHTVCEYLVIMREELDEAFKSWTKQHSDEKAMQELLQVVATGVAAMEQHGVYQCPKRFDYKVLGLMNELETF